MSFTALPVLVAASDDEFHKPSIAEFFPDSIFSAEGPLGFLNFLEGTPLDMNRIILVRLLAFTVLALLFYFGLRKATVVPGKFQSIIELAVTFVKVEIVDGVLGEKLGKKYLPVLATMFFSILFANMTGMIPGLNIAGTSLVAMPLILGLVAYITFIYAGFKEVGVGTFFKNALFPSGVPVYIYPVLAPVELLNIFIVRPLSLALRLLLNMVVGHLLLVLTFAATHFFVFSSYFNEDWVMRLLGIPTLAMGIFMTLLELLVAFLQAYVFTLLTASYIQQAAAEEH